MIADAEEARTPVIANDAVYSAEPAQEPKMDIRKIFHKA